MSLLSCSGRFQRLVRSVPGDLLPALLHLFGGLPQICQQERLHRGQFRQFSLVHFDLAARSRRVLLSLFNVFSKCESTLTLSSLNLDNPQMAMYGENFAVSAHSAYALLLRNISR